MDTKESENPKDLVETYQRIGADVLMMQTE